MTIKRMMRASRSFIRENSSNILSIAAGIGVLSTIGFAYKAGTKADAIIKGKIEDYNSIDPEDPDAKEIRKEVVVEGIKETAPLFVPVIISGVVTIVCIFSSNRISARGKAKFAAAAALSEKALIEMQTAANEVLKEKDVIAVKDKIAENRLKENPVKNTEVIMTQTNDVLCYDAFSGRYFMSSPHKIKTAVNNFNARVLDELSCDMNEFYYEIGLPPIGIGDDYGYSAGDKLDVYYSTQLSSDDRPCLTLNYEPKYLPRNGSIWRLDDYK